MKTYEYKISKEPLLSRIPGLFAYISYNSLGEAELHKATNSLDGCYGKIVEDIKLPDDMSCELINGDETVTLNGGQIYSYRTLIDYYYKFKDVLDETHPFISFIDEGIGKKKVPDEIRNECDLAPAYIYLATARSKYEWFVKRKKLCDAYDTGMQNDPEYVYDGDICCACEEYERSGGDTMMNLLAGYVTEAEQTASRFLNYASSGTSKLNFNIFLTASLNDLGMVSVYIDEWKAGERYNIGDLVFYDGNTYICRQDTTGFWNEDLEELQFDVEAFELIKNTAAGDIPSDADELTHYKESYPEQGLYGTSFKGIGNNYTVEGTTDSKLKTLRRYKDYTDSAGNVQKPSSGYDWLYYYRVGEVTNYTTANDDLGNIMHMGDIMENGNDLYAYGDMITNILLEHTEEDGYTIKFEYVLGAHLIADYDGSEPDDDGNMRYYFSNFDYDENDLYHGVKYVEIYKVDEDSEIITEFTNEDGSINDTKFQSYINSDEEYKYDNKKYEFSTSLSSESYNADINNTSVRVPSIVSEFNATIENKVDYEYNRIFRNDYYAGITYSPTTDIDIYIERGNAAALERHIKLGEIKTLEDMEWYANGGFFNITETTS